MMIAPQEAAMTAPHVGKRVGVRSAWSSLSRSERLRVGGCAGYLVLVTLLFIRPLTRLMLYAVPTDLHSHILLVPFISAYLLYLQRRRRPSVFSTSIIGTIVLGAIGIGAMVEGMVRRSSLSLNDDLALMALAFASLVAAGGFLFFGSKWMAAAAFPFAFLIFIVPLPDTAVNWLEVASMRASTEAAALFFNISGTPNVRDGRLFELPGIVIQVAQECSGIHSSWVLFITSLLASHLFLKGWWRRILVVAFVVPLGVLRNGFRVLVIGLLCVHVGPEMIDSPIHHQGGPLFFALSLGPLYLLLWWLRRQEKLPIRIAR